MCRRLLGEMISRRRAASPDLARSSHGQDLLLRAERQCGRRARSAPVAAPEARIPPRSRAPWGSMGRMDSAQTTFLRDLLAGTPWFGDCRSFARTIRTAPRSEGGL